MSNCRLVGTAEMHAADGGLQARTCTEQEHEVKWSNGCCHCALSCKIPSFCSTLAMSYLITRIPFFPSFLYLTCGEHNKCGR